MEGKSKPIGLPACNNINALKPANPRAPFGHEAAEQAGNRSPGFSLHRFCFFLYKTFGISCRYGLQSEWGRMTLPVPY